MSHHCHGNLLLILKHDRGLAILLSVLVYTQHNTPTAEGEGEGEGGGGEDCHLLKSTTQDTHRGA